MKNTAKKFVATLLAVICLFALSTSAFAAAPPAYIDTTAASAAALAHAGYSQSEVKNLIVRLDYDDGVAHYDVEFTADNTEYDYEINAVTGAVLDVDRDLTFWGEVVFFFRAVLRFFGIIKYS